MAAQAETVICRIQIRRQLWKRWAARWVRSISRPLAVRYEFWPLDPRSSSIPAGIPTDDDPAIALSHSVSSPFCILCCNRFRPQFTLSSGTPASSSRSFITSVRVRTRPVASPTSICIRIDALSPAFSTLPCIVSLNSASQLRSVGGPPSLQQPCAQSVEADLDDAALFAWGCC